jgi:bifunctional non-homologous end joining protein LigD
VLDVRAGHTPTDGTILGPVERKDGTVATLIYVIQHHRAHAVHYDFRLELDGVLVSWAVPRGPSLSPKVRRLGVRVLDHALAHADVEGASGGGAVIVWDRGMWDPEGGVEAARKGLGEGKLAFDLRGEKLRGRWHLVRTKPIAKRESWLLFKGRDADADDMTDITAEKPASVLSGRTLAEL